MKKYVIQKQTLGLPFLSFNGYSSDIRKAILFSDHELDKVFKKCCDLKQQTNVRHDLKELTNG